MDEEIEIDIAPNSLFQTFGGEVHNHDLSDYSEYGISFESEKNNQYAIYGLTPIQYKKLGLSIINHLMTNGHDFKIGNDHNGAFLAAQ